MKIIGITGGVGAGKTQILEYLNNKYGATICMAAVQEEKRNVSNQIEDVKEMIPMLKELSDDEKIYIKGMLAGFQTMRQLGIKTA